MPRQPRLLFFAYYFPPANTIGCVRTYNMAKWLTRLGWAVTVVTPRGSLWRRPEVPVQVEQALSQEGVRVIRTDHRWPILSPDHLNGGEGPLRYVSGGVCRRVARLAGIERESGWLGEAGRACAGLVPEDVDLILASGPPFGSFWLARRFGARLRRPFVLDYRDLWTSNPYASRRPRLSTVAAERGLMRSCAAATAVSPSVAEFLEEHFDGAGKVSVITNGYDREELARTKPTQFDHFAIVYTGQFYPPKSTIDPFMTVLRNLKSRTNASGAPWAFHYFGRQDRHVRESARRAGVEDKVILHGNVSHEDALSAVAGANVSLVVTSVEEEGDVRDRGVVTGKIFEAMGLRTPVLAIAPRGSDLVGILEPTGLGHCFAASAVGEMESFLTELMRADGWRSSETPSFDWANLGASLDSSLRRVIRDAADPAAVRPEPSPADPAVERASVGHAREPGS